MGTNTTTVPKTRNYVRLIVVVNFLLLLEVVAEDRVTGGGSYRALKTAGLAGLVTWATQVWVTVSTLLATAVFLWRVFIGRRAKQLGGGFPAGAALDALLLSAWWITLLGLCAYAFAVGASG